MRILDSDEERRTHNNHPPAVSRIPRFDGTVTLGSIISAIAIIVTLLSGFKSFSDRFTEIETKVNAMWVDYTVVHNSKENR